MAIDSGVFKALSEGFAVCYEGGLVPGVSAYKLGAVGSISVSEKAGIRFVQSVGQASSDSGFACPRPSASLITWSHSWITRYE